MDLFTVGESGNIRDVGRKHAPVNAIGRKRLGILIEISLESLHRRELQIIATNRDDRRQRLLDRFYFPRTGRSEGL